VILQTRLNQRTNPGTRFFDKSKMMHVQGEYKWDIKKKGQEKNWFDLTTGASFRMYLPYSKVVFSQIHFHSSQIRKN
jgi:hypothetical protein